MRDVRELAREEPEAFRRVANMADDDLQDRMLRILAEERGRGGDPQAEAEA